MVATMVTHGRNLIESFLPQSAAGSSSRSRPMLRPSQKVESTVVASGFMVATLPRDHFENRHAIATSPRGLCTGWSFVAQSRPWLFEVTTLSFCNRDRGCLRLQLWVSSLHKFLISCHELLAFRLVFLIYAKYIGIGG